MQIYRNRRKDIKHTMEGQNKSLFQLFVPLCLETIFYMLSGMVDTLMLSSVGDQAVGAVGTANTYIGVFIGSFYGNAGCDDTEYRCGQTGDRLSGKDSGIMV